MRLVYIGLNLKVLGGLAMVAKRKRFDFEEKEECSLRYLGRFRNSPIGCCMTQMQAFHRIKSKVVNSVPFRPE